MWFRYDFRVYLSPFPPQINISWLSNAAVGLENAISTELNNVISTELNKAISVFSTGSNATVISAGNHTTASTSFIEVNEAMLAEEQHVTPTETAAALWTAGREEVQAYCTALLVEDGELEDLENSGRTLSNTPHGNLFCNFDQLWSPCFSRGSGPEVLAFIGDRWGRVQDFHPKALKDPGSDKARVNRVATGVREIFSQVKHELKLADSNGNTAVTFIQDMPADQIDKLMADKSTTSFVSHLFRLGLYRCIAPDGAAVAAVSVTEGDGDNGVAEPVTEGDADTGGDPIGEAAMYEKSECEEILTSLSNMLSKGKGK